MRNKITLVATHAIQRFRERWPACGHITNKQVIRLIEDAIREATRTGDFIHAPGAKYIPFSVDGNDGYVVIGANSQVVTVLPEQYCKEVSNLRKIGVRNGQVA